MEESLASVIRDKFRIEKQDVRTYSPLPLAYIGDAVYEVVIRTMVVECKNRSAEKLHKTTVKYVNAKTQAEMIEALKESLTPEELSVYTRGRNAKSPSIPKNATISDYRKATGFEALMGYLYLTDRMDRILELVEKGLKMTGNDFYEVKL